jgi:hypothetical protein
MNNIKLKDLGVAERQFMSSLSKVEQEILRALCDGGLADLLEDMRESVYSFKVKDVDEFCQRWSIPHSHYVDWAQQYKEEKERLGL